MAEEAKSGKTLPAGRGQRQRKIGVVVSNRMSKSVRVAVERLVPHARYRKRMRHTSTFMAHDEEDECRVGDKVAITESRPLSRRKRWRVTEILERGTDATAGAKQGS